MKAGALDMLVGAAMDDPEQHYEFNIGWLDNPNNCGWRRGPDSRDRKRRAPVIAHMVERFGAWEKAA